MVVGKTALVEYKCRNCGNSCWMRKGSGPEKQRLCGPCYQKYVAQLPKKWVKPAQKKKQEAVPSSPTPGMIKCPKCGRPTYEDAGNCPSCGAKLKKSFFSKLFDKLKRKKPKKEKKSEKEGEEKPEEKKKKRIYKPGAGTTAALVLSVLGAAGGFIIGMPLVFIVICVVTAGFLIVALFKPKFVLLLPVILVISFVVLYYTGQFEVFLTVPAVADAVEQIEEAKDTIILEGSKVYETVKCYSKVNPDEVEACLEELERQKEEEVRKIGKNENLELEYGQKISGKINKNKKPDVSKPYGFYFLLKNENDRCAKGEKECVEYPIEVKSINVVAEGDGGDNKPGDVKRHIPYTIEPQEEMQVRVEWKPDNGNWLSCNNKINFLINITSIQKSGGGAAKYGLAPNEEDHMDFIHYFDPEIETNPGPLDIYVFTDPYAINFEWYDNFSVIIKVKNKAKGTASLDNVILIQTFEDPWSYFGIKECYDDEGKNYPIDNSHKYQEGECSPGGYPVNCYTLSFSEVYGHKLNLTKDEEIEIICTTTQIENKNKLTGAPDDYISVFTPSYEFLQEFKETKTAECGTAEPIPSCGDGFCDPALGEDPITCPADCESEPGER